MKKALVNINIYIVTIIILLLRLLPFETYAARLSGIAYVNSTLPSNQFSPFGDGTGNCNIDGSYRVEGSTTTTKEGNKITITTDIYAINDNGWNNEGYAAGRILVLCFDDNDLTGYERWLNNGKYIQLNFRNDKFATDIQMTKITNGNTLVMGKDKSNYTAYIDSYNSSHGLTGTNKFSITSATETSYKQHSLHDKTYFYIYNLPANCKKIYVLPIGIPSNQGKGEDRDSRSFYMPTAGSILNSNAVKVSLGYDVSYNSNGGSTTPATAKSVSSVTLPSVSRDGYTFDGWYNGNTFVGNAGATYTPSANVTLTAHWKPITYTITYKLNGGKVDYKKVKYNIETPTFYIENPTKKGFNFTGWTGTGIETATTDLSVPLGSFGDKTFEATWGEGIYSISFDGNGATSGEMETLTVTAGEEIKLPENSFVRDGYSFVGWYTTEHDRFGTFYKNGATVSDLTESVTLHAQWKKNKDTVEPGENGNGTGNGDGGSTGDHGNGGNGSGTGDDTGNGNGSGNGDGGSTGDHGNGGNGSGTGDDTGNGNGSGNGDGGSTGDHGNGGNGSGTGDDTGNGSGRGNGGSNKPVKTPEDEIGYFGTAQRRNEISILTTLGMNDNKLTLNYNY